MQNFISISDLTKSDILHLINLAKVFKNKPNPDLAKNKIVATLFFESSTRTRLSFTSAAYRLGANVLGLGSSEDSSLKKGESFEDTIKVISNYADLLIIRHSVDGAAKLASNISNLPIINAGDGKNEHPSQTLLDLFTIEEYFGTLENKKIAFVGDLKYGRTVHSLVKALKLFNCEMFFVAPDIIQIPDNILNILKESDIKYSLHNDFKEILNEIDIFYMTRIQKERFENLNEYKKVSGVYSINKENILNKCKENMIILHPLPRVDEIDTSLDDTKHALYFKQAENGLYMREAMISTALGLI